jgi:hypothetical protein
MNRHTPIAHPDWTALVAARDARGPQGDEPAGWAAALDHMDRCEPCRRRALALDPLLVFRRLGPSEAAETAPSEAESMKAAVAAMRRARRVESAETAVATPSAGSWGSWRRMAAAAVLVASLAGGSTLLLDPFSPEGRMSPVGSATTGSSMTAPLVSGVPVSTGQDAPPLVENLDRPDADVVQLGGEEMAVVMILDAGLDV